MYILYDNSSAGLGDYMYSNPLMHEVYISSNDCTTSHYILVHSNFVFPIRLINHDIYVNYDLSERNDKLGKTYGSGFTQ